MTILRLPLSMTALLFALAQTASAQPSETPAPRGHGKAEFVTSYDANSDAIVARAEFDTRRGLDFARIDVNSDRNATSDEYVSEYTTRLDAEIAAMRARQIAQARVRFGALDTNGDGSVSQSEFDASGQRCSHVSTRTRTASSMSAIRWIGTERRSRDSEKTSSAGYGR